LKTLDWIDALGGVFIGACALLLAAKASGRPKRLFKFCGWGLIIMSAVGLVISLFDKR
jgi:hypothetical protein